MHPQLSAYACLYGAFNYNCTTSLAPPGTKMLMRMHEKPKQQGTWDDLGIAGWHIGPTLLHYHYYRCYLPATLGERISDTVKLYPTQVNMPHLSAQEKAIQAVRDLIHTIRNPSPASPFPTFGPKHSAALDQLATIFNTNSEIALSQEREIVTSPTSSPRQCFQKTVARVF